jgi:hypothetical protein
MCRKFQEVNDLTVPLEKTYMYSWHEYRIKSDVRNQRMTEISTVVVTDFGCLRVKIHALYSCSKDATCAIVVGGVKLSATK